MLQKNVNTVAQNIYQENTKIQDFAVKNVQVSHVKIKAIKKLGKENVYNMEVEKHHNFAVNGGYIVHNCADAIRYYCNTFAGKPQIKTFNRSLLAI